MSSSGRCEASRNTQMIVQTVQGSDSFQELKCLLGTIREGREHLDNENQ